MGWRRVVLLGLIGGNVAMLLGLAWLTLAPGGPGALKIALAVCIVLNAPWLGLSAATGLVGAAIRLGAADPVAAVLPTLRGMEMGQAPLPRTAIAVCLRDEAVAPVAARLAGLLAGLAAAGQAEGFVACLLSDTTEPALAAEERRAAAALAARFGAARVCYRRREENIGFKAGNVMSFLDAQADAAAGGFELMLCLDADSDMSPAAVLRLVGIMRAEPRLAIVQATFAGHPAADLFARLLQVGHRQGLRVWATGQAWWQADQGPYWGHNAIVRIAPFRACCRLGLLPDGQSILSHDHIEAARLQAAGWAVRVLPDDTGSHEEQPPSLPEFIRRDVRWAAGNLQYRFLLRDRSLGRVGRLQMLQAILHYALTPFWFAMLPLSALLCASGGAAAVRLGPLLALLCCGAAQLHAPKLLGTLEALLRPAVARPLGGRRAVLRAAVAELAFTALLDTLLALGKAAAVLWLLASIRRRGAGWGRSERGGGRLGAAAAARQFWPHSLVGLLIAGLFGTGSWTALLLALPAVAGLILSIPFAIVTSRKTPAWLGAPNPDGTGAFGASRAA